MRAVETLWLVAVCQQNEHSEGRNCPSWRKHWLSWPCILRQRVLAASVYTGLFGRVRKVGLIAINMALYELVAASGLEPRSGVGIQGGEGAKRWQGVSSTVPQSLMLKVQSSSDPSPRLSVTYPCLYLAVIYLFC